MGIPVDEIIGVGAVFRGGKIRPVWFDWQGRRYRVVEITMRWHTKQGRATVDHFGVSDGANLYELVFNHETAVWRLASVADEGG
jgi:hypothetical protein